MSGPDIDHRALLERTISASEMKLLAGAQELPVAVVSAEAQEVEVMAPNTQVATPNPRDLEQLALF